MPNIAQQDYIIIDWEGKDGSDAAKKAEVDAILKNLYLANPLSLLSVIFKDYDGDTGAYDSIISAGSLDGENIDCRMYSTQAQDWMDYEFSIV